VHIVPSAIISGQTKKSSKKAQATSLFVPNPLARPSEGFQTSYMNGHSKASEKAKIKNAKNIQQQTQHNRNKDTSKDWLKTTYKETWQDDFDRTFGTEPKKPVKLEDRVRTAIQRRNEVQSPLYGRI